MYKDDQLSSLLAENKSPQVAIIVISSDRGLCGGFIANLFKKLNQQIVKNKQVDLYLIGNKAYQLLKNKDVTIAHHRSNFQSSNNLSEKAAYIDDIINKFKQGVYSKVYVVYTLISLPDWKPDTITTSDFIYESSKQSALDALLSKYINYNFNRAVLESQASEEGSRMAAMDSASSNANEMIDELTLYFNRSRQAAITTELTEIIAGAASLS